jgi:O-antigen/teichoic acid export membrane protein
MTSVSDNKRVAKNTLVLYFRMLFMMLIGLYTSRINLQSLGVEDFGIYNVVGGIVVMFSIINGSITASISRFLTFEIGTGNMEKLKKVFSTSVTIQIGISLLILLLAETIGLWFLNHKMVIPDSRMPAAHWVYQFSIITFILNLISMPYNACIVAHEKMSAFAWITIYDAIAKLLIAWLTFIAPMDKLIFFSGFIVLIAFTQRMIYTSYCLHNFEECHYKFTIDKELLKHMSGFAGWNFIGASSAILRDTGGNIIINLFCGPAVNAARAIANRINTAVLGFANSFMTAINPQITKSYASGEYEKMMGAIYKGAKFSFFLLLLLGLPVIMESEYIIHLWLGQVPEHTVLFVQLTILYA